MQSNDVQGLTISLAKAGLTAGTTSTYTTAAATAGSIGGKFVTPLTAQTNTATPTTDGNGDAFTSVGDDQGCVFVFCTNAAGAIKVFQGNVVDLDAAGNFKFAPDFPAIDLTAFMPFGYVVLENETGSAFDFGSSSFATAGITDTWHDVTTLPTRPQAA